MPSQNALTIEERLVTGGVSAVVAMLTAVVVAVGLFLHGPADLEFWTNFLRIAAVCCIVAGLLGFVIGPDNMARHFGFLWGTEEPSKVQVAVLTAGILILCGVVLFGWPSWL